MAKPRNSQREATSATDCDSAIFTRSNVSVPVALLCNHTSETSDTSMNAEPSIVNRKNFIPADQRGPDHREQENLHRRVDARAVAPTANEEVHRDEHDLERDEEQEEVER